MSFLIVSVKLSCAVMDFASATGRSLVSSADSPHAFLTVKDFIGYYNNYLPVTMNPKAVTQLKILSQQLLYKDIVLAALKNRINLDSVRVMSSQAIQSFVELLLTKYSQKYIGTMLTNVLQKSFIIRSIKSRVYQHSPLSECILMPTKIDPTSVVMEFLNLKFRLNEVLKHCYSLSPLKIKSDSLLASGIYNKLKVEKNKKAINVKVLQKRIAQKDKKYNDLLVKYKELERVSEEKELKEKMNQRLEENITMKRQTYFELQEKCEELQGSLSLGNEVQSELTNLQLTVEKVNTSLLGDKSIRSLEAEEFTDGLPFTTKLKKLHSKLKKLNSTTEEWSAVMQLLERKQLSDSNQKVDQLKSQHSDSVHKLEFQLSDIEEKVNQLESQNNWLERHLKTIQEEGKIKVYQLAEELSEKDSQLMIKDKKLTKLNADQKLLEKRFNEIKQQLAEEKKTYQSKLEAYEAKQSEQAEELKSTCEKLSQELIEKHQTYQRTLDTNEKRINELTEHTEELKSTIEKLDEELTKKEQTYHTRLITYEREVKEQTEQRMELKSRIEIFIQELAEEKQTNQRKLHIYDERITRQTMQIKVLKSTIENKRKLIQKITKKKQTYQKKLKSTTESKQKFVQKFTKEKQIYQKKLDAYEREIDEQTKQILELHENKERLIQELNEEKQTYQRKLKSKERFTLKLTKEKQTYQRKLLTCDKKKSEHTKQIKVLKLKIEDKEKLIQKLQRENKQLTEENYYYLIQLKRLRIIEKDKLISVNYLQKNMLKILSSATKKDFRFTLGTARPTMKQLYFIMKQIDVVIKWHELGLQLLNKEYVRYLGIIRKDNPTNSKGCCTEMLKLWLNTTPDANWNQLCKALNVMDLPDAAEGLINELCRDARENGVSAYTARPCHVIVNIVTQLQWQAEKEFLRSAEPLILQYCSKEVILACNKKSLYFKVINTNCNINLLEAVGKGTILDIVKQLFLQHKDRTELNPAACYSA